MNVMGGVHMSYQQLNLYVEKNDFENIKKTIDLAVCIPSRLKDDLEGWAFSKYSEGGPRIAVRLNFKREEDMKKAEDLAEELKKSGRIQKYDWQPEGWGGPDFVIKAAEIATECSCKFRELLEKYPVINDTLTKEIAQDTKRPISFLYCLLSSLLDTLANVTIIWEYQRWSRIPYEKVKKMTAGWITSKPSISDEQYPSFLERFVHHFLNCIGMREILFIKETGGEKKEKRIHIEGEVTAYLLFSKLWSTLAEKSE